MLVRAKYIKAPTLAGCILTFCLILLSSFDFNQEDQVNELYQLAEKRLSKEGAMFLKNHFVKHTEPCKSIADVGGWVWRCTLRDGFATYNCFRKCRGTIEVARLFLGLNKDEDCDSFKMVNGKRESVCYPKQATQIVRDHGPVTAIEIIRGWP
jgi:hypothetical protein